MLNKLTGKELDKDEIGQEIFTCPKCGKIHTVANYVYAQMSIDRVIHTCKCGQKTRFYNNEMWY